MSPIDPAAPSAWTRRSSDHLFSRAAFGGTPEQREAFYQLGRTQGIAAAVDSLVGPGESWSAFPYPAWATSDPNDPNGDAVSVTLRRRDFVFWYFDQLASAQPLAAKLLKFYLDHFPIDQGTLNQYTRFLYYFRHFDLLRKHAAGNGNGPYGNFKNLVTDVSWSEGMIRMLDLYRSSARAVNENFGRELLELFTLGVDGGYSEDDVGAAAAAFTGRKLYNIQPPSQPPSTNLAPAGVPPASPYQVENQRDRTAKTFLGKTQLPGGGAIVSGDDIITVIFDNPQCARHTAWKLWRYFASPEPSSELLEALTVRLKDVHGYRIRPFLRDLFLSRAFFEVRPGSQIKDGADFFVTAVKTLGAPMLPGAVLFEVTEQIGYNIFFPPNIAGWPEPDGEGNQWLSAGATLARLNLPGLWTHRNPAILIAGAARTALARYDDLDLDAIAPPELRGKENFNLLLAALSRRFLPFHPLRPTQVRALYDRYVAVLDAIDEVQAIREIIRLIMALPEYELQ